MINGKSFRTLIKFSSIILVSLGLALLFLNFPEIKRGRKFSFRELALDDIKVQAICEKGPDSVLSFYTDANYQFPEEKESDYNNTYTQTLIDIIDGKGDKESIIKYGMRLLAFVLFIVFGILSVFGWIICCCCCCCPCCCCKQTAKNQYLCRLVAFVISMGCFGLIVGLSSYGFFGLMNIMKSMNGMSCTVFKFYLEILNGQTVERTPKWSGIQEISSSLEDIKNTIVGIQGRKNDIFWNVESFPNKKGEFQSTLSTSPYTPINPNTIQVNSQSFTPNYLISFNPYDTANTILNTTNEEYALTVDQGYAFLHEADQSATSICSDDNLDSQIDGIKQTIADFGQTLDDFSTSVAEPWMDLENIITDYGTLGCNVLFGVFVGFGALIIGFTVLFVVLKMKCLKIFIFIMWNILVLIMIVTFIIGGIFGLIGIIGKDGTSVIHFLISQDNLSSEKPTIVPSSVSGKLITCLYGDGDLSKDMNPDAAKQIQKLNEMRNKLEEVRTNLTSHRNSITLTNYNTTLKTYEVEFNTVSYLDNSVNKTFQTLLDQLNTLTYDNNCTSTIERKDKWATNQSDCGGLTFIQELPDTNDVNYGNSFCLSFSIGITKAEERYTGCDNSNTIKETLNKLYSIKDQNKKIIDELYKASYAANQEFNSVTDDLLETIQKVEDDLLDPIHDLLSGMDSGSSDNFIATLVNCNFIYGHLRILYENIHDGLGSNFYKFAIIIETISCSMALGISTLLIVLNRFNKTYPEDQKKKDKANEINTTMNAMNAEVIQINKAGGGKKSLDKGRIVIKNI